MYKNVKTYTYIFYPKRPGVRPTGGKLSLVGDSDFPERMRSSTTPRPGVRE